MSSRNTLAKRAIRIGKQACVIGLSITSFSHFAHADFSTADKSTRLVTNQIGYVRQAQKSAILYSLSGDLTGNWQLRQAQSNHVAAQGRLKKPSKDPLTGYFVYQIDFSHIEQNGQYRMHSGPYSSYTFSIDSDPYQSLLISMLRSYYLQRCGVAIDDPHTGLSHAKCHLNDGLVSHENNSHQKHHPINAAGGWHDAGDYGKYVATTAAVVQDILTRYERHTASLGLFDIQLPIASTPLPDLLAEMQVGLDWMLSMQRPDGAVYRKVGGNHWSKLVSPEYDRQQRFLYGVSSPETAKAAAAWALAARIYKPHDSQLAGDYLAAAERAWQWLNTLTDDMVFDFQPGDNSGSGPYSVTKIDLEEALTHDRDDRFAAAVEMYLTTGDTKWQKISTELLVDLPLAFFEWKNVSSLAMFSLRWHPRAADMFQAHSIVDERLRKLADTYLSNTETSPFKLANQRFVWGSNKIAAAQGSILFHAWHRFGEQKYLDAAFDQVHYLLGRNPLNISFVSGFGQRAVSNVSHMIARGTGQHIPGLMVGGPNELAQAGFAPKNKGPLSYIDAGGSYATNEYAIDYNSSLITLLWDLTQTGDWYQQALSQLDD